MTTLKIRSKKTNLNYPINIYAVNLDGFIKNGTNAVYNDLLHTVSSYVKYMGYTHVLLLSEYCKNVGKLSNEKRLTLINTFHSNGIKVIFKVVPKDVIDKKLYIYALIHQIKELGIDGLFFDIPFPQYCDKSLLKEINDEIHTGYPGVITVCGNRLAGSSAEAGFDLIFDLDLYGKACDYISRDPYFRRFVQAAFEEKLFSKDGESRLIPLSPLTFETEYKSFFSSAYGSYEDKLMQKRSIDLLFVSLLGKKLSLMGDEFAGYLFEEGIPVVDWGMLDSEAHSNMRSYVRELNHFYLSTPILWNDSFEASLIPCEDIDKDKNVIAFKKVSLNDEILTVINLSGIAQSISIRKPGSLECVFATEHYIGKESIKRILDSEDVYSITLPAFCGAVYRFK